jgi:hypothetical protein
MRDSLAELRDVVHELPYEEPPSERMEELRLALLAQAATIRPRPPPRLRARAVTAAAAGALAASAALVLLRAPAVPLPLASSSVAASSSDVRGHLTPAGEARYEHVTRHLDSGASIEEVRLTSGVLRFQVDRLRPGEQFLVRTSDAEVEVRGTVFDVAVRDDHLASVAVIEGKVEVRVLGAPTVVLAAGEHWEAPAPAGRARSSGGPQRHARGAPPAPLPGRSAEPRELTSESQAEPGVTSLGLQGPSPGELAFAAGWDALRAGSPALAADLFRTVAASEPLGEEAAYWRIVAETRAGNREAAVMSMRAFLEGWPSSPRSGEVSLDLGLQLTAAGETSSGRDALEAAAPDPVASVRERALEALQRLQVGNSAPSPR